MLGQFFGSRKTGATAHQSSSSSTTHDFAVEESHTRRLLFPDHTPPQHPADSQWHSPQLGPLNNGSGHDGPLAEIDLEFPRDVRIIIAQDELGLGQRCVLFDSKPRTSPVESPTQSNTGARSRLFGGAGSGATTGPTFGGGLHARRSSLVTESTTPRSPTTSAFARTRGRNPSISSMPNIDEHAQGQPRAKESSIDLAKICLDCMFGNTPMNYRGIGNKMHILPLESRISDPYSPAPNLHDATNSLGRAEGRRKSQLAKSYTPATLPAPAEAPRATADASREPRRRTVLITRTFSVAPPTEEQDSSTSWTPTPQSSAGKGNGFPFPRQGNRAGTAKAPQPSQALKTPMYGITMILSLPLAPARPPSRSGRPNFKGPGHVPTSAPGENDSLGSSLDSDRRAGWTVVGEPSLSMDLLATSMNSDVDDRVDVLGQHWDVISRSLTSLQFVVQDRILAHFKAQEINSPPIIQQPRLQTARLNNREVPIHQPPRRTLKLQPNALVMDKYIHKAVDVTGERVVRGVRIPRAVAGRGNWGQWRDEAMWLGRWANRKEENFFFFNLLTCFLGHHTEWLNQIGPKRYRRLHREQQRANAGEFMPIPNRTVIVSPDKMAARRLVYLLAAFLPQNMFPIYDSHSPIRPGTSSSFRAYSQSPPTNMALSRKQSLRRTISRRPRGKPSATNLRVQASTSNGSGSEEKPLNTSAAATLRERRQHSRGSSVHSIKTSLVIPSMADSSATTRSGTAAMAALEPKGTDPVVAHITLPRAHTIGTCEPTPTAGQPLASANSLHTLLRGPSGHASTSSTDSGGTSRWGSFMSFWSGGRRESSTSQSDILQTTDDGLGISGMPYRAQEQPRSQLEYMVQELQEIYLNEEFFGDCGDEPERSAANTVITADSSPEHHPIGGSSGVPPSAARPIPERPKQFESPLKLSVNEKDGVIDVDIPLPDFGSPLQSPLLGGFPNSSSQPGSSFGESSIISMPPYEPEQPVNVAGWISEFHPDFAVQAIKPYKDLERDIKRAMSAEPTPMTSTVTPTLEQGPLERWIDICSALVADTRSFTIKRIKLRRLVRIIPTPTYHQSAMTPGVAGIPGRSQYGNPYSASGTGPLMAEVHLKEEFTEETLMDWDQTLVDALDRVLGDSNPSSRDPSVTSSRSSSRRGRRDTRSGSDVGTIADTQPQIDVKTVIFEALENVVKTVTTERSAKDDPDAEKKKPPSTKALVAIDSTLREGIRRWLAEVE